MRRARAAGRAEPTTFPFKRKVTVIAENDANASCFGALPAIHAARHAMLPAALDTLLRCQQTWLPQHPEFCAVLEAARAGAGINHAARPQGRERRANAAVRIPSRLGAKDGTDVVLLSTTGTAASVARSHKGKERFAKSIG
jgi:hypothetical protein